MIFQILIELISKAIKQEPASIIREGGVINPEYNEELFQLCSIKTNAREFIRNLEDEEKEKQESGA